MNQEWSEEWIGGSPEAERKEFAALAEGIMQVQLKNQKAASAKGVRHGIDRSFHAKSTLAVDGRLTILDLTDDLRTGFAQPGASYRTIVRFSNAAGLSAPDFKPDLRGVALRIEVPDGAAHDLLMTNYPVSHARNARQFMAFARCLAGGPAQQAIGVPKLAAAVGVEEAIRMLRVIKKGREHLPSSIATETYWSRGAMRWGETLAVRYLLRPAPETAPAPPPSTVDPEFLSHEIAARLAEGDVRFELCIQRYVNTRSTPIEDTSVEWTESASPAEPVALLTLSQADVCTVDALAYAREVDAMAFNPWNTTDAFRPLGNLNRARKAAYDAGAAHRVGYRFKVEPPKRNVVLGSAVRAGFGLLNRRFEWWQLPHHVGLLNLDALRHQLRAHNLIDTEPQEAPPAARAVPFPPAEPVRVTRTFDGTGNDLSKPEMGAVGATFGRNLPPRFAPDKLDDPNPVIVSRELLYREKFLPARSLNVLAASWIQFQVHDWVNHARHPLGMQDVSVPLPAGMTWQSKKDGPAEDVMRIAGNISLDADSGGAGRLFANDASHWWDSSEVYGSDPQKAFEMREGAKLRMTPGGYLPEDVNGQEITGFNESWWLGLSGLHTLFAREHNVLCDELRAHYRGWTDERVYQTARLIVAALIAKIHTVEWTPAILATDAIDVALKNNWVGPPANDWLTKLGLWLVDAHSTVGIPETMPDHHGAPYALTEDFATVYRLHPLLPDDYRFADHRSGDLLGHKSFLDIHGDRADEVMRSYGLENILYSFGIAHPGAITLHNYPRTLQDFVRDDEHIDLSVIDLVRTRHRGIPRYNDFRAGLHKKRITRWEDLTANPESVQRLREVYRSIDDVDTMVGLFAETPPPGFGFSDTAFRIFILMASRRLQSDRFLTVDFRPEIYSPFGMDWIERNGMTSVILRHCPDLLGTLPRDRSAFAPWRPVAGSADGHAAGVEATREGRPA